MWKKTQSAASQAKPLSEPAIVSAPGAPDQTPVSALASEARMASASGASPSPPPSSRKTLGAADIMRVLRLLPHRYPFLMVDRIIDMDGDNYGVGVKNVSINEPHFQGHFPAFPVMPGVLLIEGIAQTAGALCVASLGEDYEPQLVYFMAIDKARFRRPVVPGDTVYFHVTKKRNRGRVWRFAGEAKVNGQHVCDAEVSAMIVDPNQPQGPGGPDSGA
jgi:3-hydroxyacyl-[acyl-carrier-protein] dehydratase